MTLRCNVATDQKAFANKLGGKRTEHADGDVKEPTVQ